MTLPFRFPKAALPPEAEALRAEIRAFCASELAGVPEHRRALSWMAHDAAFSRKLGACGWLGLTWPKRYGGHERTALERHVVVEELLAAGAPVAAHWIADRQSGPLLLRYGTEAQRLHWLPRIARGEAFFCIGMSEPEAGSDLAGVRTRGTREGGGWRIDGRKIWTSGAQHAHAMIALVRTGEGTRRHDGLSQFLIPLDTPGITIRPIADLTGDENFAEVTFDGVRLPEDALIGAEGEGWAQVTAELAFERSGPERFLSTFRLLAELVRVVGPHPDALQAAVIGRLVAHLVTLRQMALATAGRLQSGEDPSLEAALVKDLGARVEQEIPEAAHALVPAETREVDPAFDATLAIVTRIAPLVSLRGGTREILRGIIARGLGLR